MRISLINLFVFRERQINSERNVPFSETLDALHEEADTGDSYTVTAPEMLYSPSNFSGYREQ